MTRQMAIISIGVLAIGATLHCGSTRRQPRPLETPFPPHPVGAQLYEKYCALCHGESGEGYLADEATALASQDFLVAASDSFIADNTGRGRPGTPMSAWGREYGGALDPQDAAMVVSHLRSWQTESSINTSKLWKAGRADKGSEIYARECETCHGYEGKGARYMTLNNAVFQETATDGFIGFTVEQGRRKTKMPRFGNKLRRRQIQDLIAYLRSIPKDTTFSRLFSAQEGDASWEKPAEILFPQNPPAVFNLRDNRFVKAAEVYKAYQKQQSFLLIDARPHSDYLLSHIEGAVSIPFYDVENRLDEIPKDRWVITYCGCPHAISGKALDTLRAHGYQKSGLLDEGFYVWGEMGYPINKNREP